MVATKTPKEEDQMQHPTREKYMDRLRSLPIENPTIEDMAAVCPHLTPRQAVAALVSEKTYGYVACPPVLVRGAFQVVSLSQSTLRLNYPGRTRRSCKGRKLHRKLFVKHPFMIEATTYAERHWGDQLILDGWESCIEIYVQDPSELTERGFPRTKTIVYFTTDRKWDTINGHSRPQSVMIDDAIASITLNLLEARETRFGHDGFTEFACAYCGGGLGLSHCTNCGKQFSDDHFRCGWDTPLPKRIVELLEKSDHVFQMDPAIAQQRERERWEKVFA